MASTISSLSEAFLEEAGERLQQACFARIGEDVSFEAFEVEMHAVANEIVRRRLAAHLQALADQQAEQLWIDGKEYRRHEPGTVGYYTLCGKVDVKRWSYRAVGVRNGATVIPLDLQAQLMFHTTPALAYSMATGYAAGPMRQYEMHLRAAHRQPPPRATLERVAKKIGGCVAQDVVSIEQRSRRGIGRSEGTRAGRES